ncbi:MAG: hypothetical protein K9N34_07045 [Candidatus Marinimicrobia bacterium]|nr:hypothetical protein [Candidatus Neomarinimicrobiota bacterium]MCF7840178.1 hypothetical protein [Candidatus Neomarinimicrobiota bacterium]
MNLRGYVRTAGGQYDTTQMYRSSVIIHLVHLLIGLSLVWNSAVFAQLTFSDAKNPHHGGDCIICHPPGQEPTRENYQPGSCEKCHSAAAVDVDIHPLFNLNLTAAGITIPDTFPLLDQDSVTCITCHIMPVKYDRSNSSFLRGGPYKEEIDFCYQCHEREQYAKLNPHAAMITDDGSVDRNICQVCHVNPPNPETPAKVAREMSLTMEATCNKCHALHTHEKNHWGINISKAKKGIYAQFQKSEQVYNIILPLGPNHQIQCNTCHYVHGRLGIDAVAFGGPGDNPYFLRMPPAKLCYMCHNI